jgi:hypothetical protein
MLPPSSGWWRQYAPLKHRSTPARLHSTVSHNNNNYNNFNLVSLEVDVLWVAPGRDGTKCEPGTGCDLILEGGWWWWWILIYQLTFCQILISNSNYCISVFQDGERRVCFWHADGSLPSSNQLCYAIIDASYKKDSMYNTYTLGITGAVTKTSSFWKSVDLFLACFPKMKVDLSNHLSDVCLSVSPPLITFEPLARFSWYLVGR